MFMLFGCFVVGGLGVVMVNLTLVVLIKVYVGVLVLVGLYLFLFFMVLAFMPGGLTSFIFSLEVVTLMGFGMNWDVLWYKFMFLVETLFYSCIDMLDFHMWGVYGIFWSCVEAMFFVHEVFCVVMLSGVSLVGMEVSSTFVGVASSFLVLLVVLGMSVLVSMVWEGVNASVSFTWCVGEMYSFLSYSSVGLLLSVFALFLGLGVCLYCMYSYVGDLLAFFVCYSMYSLLFVCGGSYLFGGLDSVLLLSLLVGDGFSFLLVGLNCLGVLDSGLGVVFLVKYFSGSLLYVLEMSSGGFSFLYWSALSKVPVLLVGFVDGGLLSQVVMDSGEFVLVGVFLLLMIMDLDDLFSLVAHVSLVDLVVLVLLVGSVGWKLSLLYVICSSVLGALSVDNCLVAILFCGNPLGLLFMFKGCVLSLLVVGSLVLLAGLVVFYGLVLVCLVFKCSSTSGSGCL